MPINEICNSKIGSLFMFMKKKLLLLFLFCINLTVAQDKALIKVLSEFENERITSGKIVEIERTLSKSSNDSLKVEGLYALGKAYFRLEKYDKSFDSYSKALIIANQIKSQIQIGAVNEALGNLLFKLDDFDKSEALYKESLLIFSKINDVNRVAKIKGNLALVDVKKGNTDKAIRSLKALREVENLDIVSKAIALLSIGNIYLEKLSNPRLAIAYYQESISLISTTQESNLICSINQNIAESYLDLKQYEEALQYNKKSEAFLNVENNNELRATLYLFYAEIYEGQANPTLALKNYKLYQQYQKIVDDSKNSSNIENIEVINQLKNNEIQNKLKEQKIQILKTEKALAVTKNYLLIFLILIICFFIFLGIKKQKSKISKLYNRVTQSQDKLKYTENKTEKIILNIHQNNDFIKHFATRLKEIQCDINDDKIKKNLNSLIFELQNNKTSNLKNDELYNDISSAFLYNLDRLYPTLTEEERKICSLIFLNYKNKEIATSLNLSLRSVENCRYRIRKKLNIETATSLYQFFQKLQ